MIADPFTRQHLPALLECFDAGAEKRGRVYASKKYAVIETRTAEEIRGRCRNSSNRIYRCLVRVRGETMIAECTCPVGDFCKHCVALLIAAAQGPSTRPARPAERTGTRRTMNDWRSLVAELTTADGELPLGIDTYRPVALMFALKPTTRGAHTITLQPVTTGKTGRWVVSRLTWHHLLSVVPEDPHDPDHLDLLRRIAASLDDSRYWSSGVSAVSIAMASPRTWDLLRDAAEAGIPFVPAVGGRQPADVVLTDGFSTGLHVQREDDGVSVSVEIMLDGDVIPTPRTQRTGLPRTSGICAIVDDVLFLGPVASLTATETRLLERGESVYIPADDLDEFSAALPALAGSRTVEVDDGAVVPQVVTGPQLHLRIDVADDCSSRLQWLIEYTVDDSPRQFTVFDEFGASSLRDPAAEDARWNEARPDLVAVAIEAFPTWQQASAGVLKAMLGDPTRRQVLQQNLAEWRRIAHADDPIDTVLDTPPTLLKLPLELTPLETALVCDLAVPAIEERGAVEVSVSGDADFRKAERPPVLRFSQGETDDQTDWFDLAITVDVDGTEVPLADLITCLTRGETHMVLADGTYFALDMPGLDQLRTLLDEAREMGELDGDKVSGRTHNVTLWEELLQLGVVDEQLREWQRRLTRLSHARPPQPVSPPSGLRAKLRPYQQDGFDWLSFLWENELGGILADDMGLGKTVQTLALIAQARQSHPNARFLVVAPTSVVSNWAAEAGKFVPGVPVATVTSTAKRMKTPLADTIGEAAVVVTSYALLRIDYDSYAGVDWAGAVFDEAQFLKNHDSQVHQCARKLAAPFKLAITGTPMENRVMELWALVSITAPGLFSSPKLFKEHFASPIERGHAPERLEVFRRRLKPIMLRRTKDQVLTELPPKQEQVVDLTLEPTHRKIYDTFLARERQQLLGLLDDFEGNRIRVLRALTRLRQLSLHPGLVDDDHAAVRSAKIDYLAQQLPVLVDEGHSALVFSSFTGFLGKLSASLDDAGVAHSYLDGTMTGKQRAAQIEAFTSGARGVFLISLKAGGFGLNLTNADYCFMADPWWNPAAENQAVDRTHRIGQQRPVTVYRMVSEGTVEEKVIELQNRKRELFSALIDDGAQFSGAITADDVRALLS